MTSVHAHNAYASIKVPTALQNMLCVYFNISMCMHARNVVFKSKQYSDQKIFLLIACISNVPTT